MPELDPSCGRVRWPKALDGQFQSQSIFEIGNYTLTGGFQVGGAAFVPTLYGKGVGWEGHFLVGYWEGHPCPACATPVVKTGNTSSYICPTCQP